MAPAPEALAVARLPLAIEVDVVNLLLGVAHPLDVEAVAPVARDVDPVRSVSPQTRTANQ
jgi:hypothetical protein